MAPVLQAARIPMISPFSTNPKVTLVGDCIFRVCFLDPFQGIVAAKFAFQDLNARAAMVVMQKGDPDSKELGQYFIGHYTKIGGKILQEESYMKGATDFSIPERKEVNRISLKDYRSHFLFLFMGNE